MAVAGAIQTIGFLTEQGKSLYGVRDLVKELRDELETLQSYLQDANERRHDNPNIHTWVRQAGRLAYRADDIIEEYAIEVASERGGGGEGFFGNVARRIAGIVGECIAIYNVRNEINKIKKEIVSLKNKLEDYGISGIIEAQPLSATIDQQRRQRTTYSHEVEAEKDFVGMEDDVSKIVTWVTEDDMNHRVISICGTGGSGKTTIARQVFNHFKKNSQRIFERSAWVSVTQQCRVKKLLHDILIQIMGEKSEDKFGHLEEEALVRMLVSELKTKKCFVVLDDIWKLKDWKSLRPAFPISEGGSKILLTTRIGEVAEVAQQDSRHEPKLLKEKDGWDLLTKIALNHKEGQGLPETEKNLGKNMLHKCGGLPLAISALGGILRNKDPFTEWEMVNKNFGTYLGRAGGVIGVLAFSYDDLPSYLRPCFLYMGCFKEDEEIDITRLYQLWMAEGLVPTRQKGREEPLMDVASDFLHELISRNMVQPLVWNEKTKMIYCRLHDLMRELCLEKGREEEFMEVKSIQIHAREVGSALLDGVDLCRQTILVDGENECEISIAKSTGETCFRALIFNQSNTCMVEGAIKFRRLRLLILDNCRFKDKKLPKEIRDMIHLRYLSLANTLEKGELPAFIGDLQYLQILDVSNNDELQLPNIFHKMKRLRCLYLPKHRVESKSGKRLEFHGLNELEVVEGLDSDYDQFPDLSKLVNLGRLECTIGGYEELSTILEQLSSQSKICSSRKLNSATPRRRRYQKQIRISFETEESGSELAKWYPDVTKQLLLCPSLHTLSLGSRIGEFPRYEHHFCPDLVDLLLWKTKLEEDPMPFLQELPNLRILTMYGDAYVGKEMYCSSKAFPKLIHLSIFHIPTIEKWRVDAGAFPNLQSLDIIDCESFEEIVPDGLTGITTLTRIDMYGMPEEFINKYGRLPNSTTTGL